MQRYPELAGLASADFFVLFFVGHRLGRVLADNS